jgi:outer membrane phospholipase A
MRRSPCSKPDHAQTYRRRLFLACACALGVLLCDAAQAGISVLQPPKRVDASKPLELTVLVSEDEQDQRTYRLPPTLLMAASADMIPPLQIAFVRDGADDSVTLKKGEFRKVRYRGTLPGRLRGMVRLEPIGIDAAPALVAVVRPEPGQPPVDAPPADAFSQAVPAAPSASVVTPGTDAPAAASIPAAEDILANSTRLSFNEPTYFLIGNSGDNTNAKFQLSFKFRLFMPNDLRSRSLSDNLYFGYTQYSLWDLSAPSAPFRDTSYRPSLFYYLPDVGLENGVFSRIGIATGFEHESNGKDGADSRSINTYFVQPTLNVGNLNDYHLTVSPKLYAYLGPTRDNPDLGDYRGHMDLKLAYGKPDGFEFAATLRKGTRSTYGSADTQVSYPLSRLIPGTAGYLMASYFYGYGESMLTYNRKEHPQLRIGYALWR